MSLIEQNENWSSFYNVAVFFSFISLYNTAMKVFFLASSIGTCYLMFIKFKATYDKNHDSFRSANEIEMNLQTLCFKRCILHCLFSK